MSIQNRISALADIGQFFQYAIDAQNEEAHISSQVENFRAKMKQAEIKNPWFTQQNIRYSLNQWAKILTKENLTAWIKNYKPAENPKKIGIIMAGNLPLVGFHDLISVLLSGHHALVKTSSKDEELMSGVLDFLKNSNDALNASFTKVERLKEQQAVIATGSNNTARYFEYYFQGIPAIIRKNRTGVAVLTGEESAEDLHGLAKDIFLYFGLGCRNVTHLYLSENFETDRLFEAFYDWNEVIHHHKYANNYEYNRAIYLLSKETFLDNNFVMLKESNDLHCPIGVVHFSRYENLSSLKQQLNDKQEEIQCIVSNEPNVFPNSIKFGETQHPNLTDYADGVDVMKFLEAI